jgi:hypothetical protein
VRKTLGKRPVGRPRNKYVDKIKVDLNEIGSEGRGWIKLAQLRIQWPAFYC